MLLRPAVVPQAIIKRQKKKKKKKGVYCLSISK